jgi:hypothetical protein
VPAAATNACQHAGSAPKTSRLNPSPKASNTLRPARLTREIGHTGRRPELCAGKALAAGVPLPWQPDFASRRSLCCVPGASGAYLAKRRSCIAGSRHVEGHTHGHDRLRHHPTACARHLDVAGPHREIPQTELGQRAGRKSPGDGFQVADLESTRPLLPLFLMFRRRHSKGSPMPVPQTIERW